MASRAELIELCKELEIDHEGLSISELTNSVRAEADRRWAKYDVHNRKLCPTKNKSRDLLKFLTEEYDYSLFDMNGNQVDVDSNIIKEKK
jgi:hypothetical protein